MPKAPVLWSREAEENLTRIWIDHPRRRNAITAAAHAIDRQLEENAEQFAVERRPDDWAVGFEPPLGIEFVVGNPVVVVRVWLPRSRKTKAD